MTKMQAAELTKTKCESHLPYFGKFSPEVARISLAPPQFDRGRRVNRTCFVLIRVPKSVKCIDVFYIDIKCLLCKKTLLRI